MSEMRAKMQVTGVEQFNAEDGTLLSERISFFAVAKAAGYPDDGSDEDNTYAKFTPNAHMNITVANPALFGTFLPGEKYYLDFTKAE